MKARNGAWWSAGRRSASASTVVSICTANQLENLSAPLRDRLEIIEVSGYTIEEKVQIARTHLVPKRLATELKGIVQGLLDFQIKVAVDVGAQKTDGKPVNERDGNKRQKDGYDDQFYCQPRPGNTLAEFAHQTPAIHDDQHGYKT